jgi:hypothetical protein
MSLRAMFRPGMRAYVVPMVAGMALAVSPFLAWVHVGEISIDGLTEMSALWVIGLGVLASVLATLSLITRRNSRHPILVIGLVSLGITFLSWRIMPRMALERAVTRSQAVAIVEGAPLGAPPETRVGVGLYLGLASSAALVAFGMTIVFKRASDAYALTPSDDDV